MIRKILICLLFIFPACDSSFTDGEEEFFFEYDDVESEFQDAGILIITDQNKRPDIPGTIKCDKGVFKGNLDVMGKLEHPEAYIGYTVLDGHLSLKNIEGISNLDFLVCLETIEGNLKIENMPDLEDISGLYNLKYLNGDHFTVSYNPRLQIEQIWKLLSFLKLNGYEGQDIIVGNYCES